MVLKQNSKRIDELLRLLENRNVLQMKNIEGLTSNKTNKIYDYKRISDTSNLEEYKDLKVYKNTNTNKIVIVGKVTKIKDRDTIVISNLFNVRMLGIDTPESKQLCRDKNKKEYNCSEKSTEYLKKLIENQNITCVNNGNEKYGRFLFVCKSHKIEDINKGMVRSGWAISYLSNLYKEDEEYARQHKLGIWSETFQMSSG